MQTLPQKLDGDSQANAEPVDRDDLQNDDLQSKDSLQDEESAKQITPAEWAKRSWAAGQSRLKSTRLRARLLQTILPAVLLPLIAANFLGYRVIAQRSEDRIQEQLSNQALLASEGTTAVLDDLLDLPRSVANSPLVINEARAGSIEAEEAGLTKMSVDDIEAKFADTKLIRQHSALNTYLQQTVETAEIAEILVTDSHGFNVAYSRPVADIVQSDETWWQNGKANQQWIGPPDFDFASKGFTVELVQAIRDSQNDDRFVGMIRAVLPTRKFSLLATTLKRTGISGSQRVQLIDGDRLSTIDTFSAQGFHKDRNIIGAEPVEKFISAFVQATQTNAPANTGASAGRTSEPTGTAAAAEIISALKDQSTVRNIALPVFDEEIVVASFTHQGRQYKVANIASSNWVAIASMEQSEIAAAGRDSLLYFSLLTLLLGALTTGIIFWLSRQLSYPIGQLTQQAKMAVGGNLDVEIEPTGTAETRFLTKTFNQLIAQTKTLIQTQSVETEKIQLFADITSAPIFNLSEMGPLLERVLPTARGILGAERLAFFQIYTSESPLDPQGWDGNHRSATSRGGILSESVSAGQTAAIDYADDAAWLPEELLNVAASEVHTVTIHSVVNEPNLDARHKTFLTQAQVKSSIIVPIVYEVRASGLEQTVDVLWGYLIAHRTEDGSENRAESSTRVSQGRSQPWQPTEVRFLERLALQLQRVLDRIAAGASVQKSQKEVQRSRLETEAITRAQHQQKESRRLENEQLKQQIAALSQDISGVFEGNLTVRADINQGELKTVAEVFNTTVAKLEELVGQVKDSTTEMDEVLSQNETFARQLAELTQQQGQEATRTLETIQKVSRSVTSVVDQAHNAAVFAQQVTDQTVAGREAVHRSSKNIETLNTISSNAVTQIRQLSRSSHNVSYMVAMISEIAVEMQSLSNKTAQDIENWANSNEAAPLQSQSLIRDTTALSKLAARALSESGLIESFLTSVDSTAQQVSEAIERINQEVIDSNQAMQISQQKMSEVLTVTQQFEQLAQSVSEAVNEQSEISQKASELVSAIVRLSEQASEFSEEIAQSLHNSATSAHSLRSSVSFFKVNPR